MSCCASLIVPCLSGCGWSFCFRFSDFKNFMYLDQDSFDSRRYLKTSCELNCISKGFSCNSLDLLVKMKSSRYIIWYFCKYWNNQKFHVHSDISITANLGVINSQFYKFWGFVLVKGSLSLTWSILLSSWKIKATL